MGRLSLNMVGSSSYLVSLGDTRQSPPNIPSLRVIPLARPESTIAAVRYVQIPQWKEMGILASSVHLSIGHADLLATLGDERFAAAAYGPFEAHACAIAKELTFLCEPGAPVTFSPSAEFSGWEWESRFNVCLQEALRDVIR